MDLGVVKAASNIIARWETRGKKWAIEIHEEEQGFDIKEFKNGSACDFSWRPNFGPQAVTKEQVIAEVERRIEVYKSIDGINYQRV
jgi:hypothetical protein